MIKKVTQAIVIIIINFLKRCSVTRVKLTALYKHLMTKFTLTYISNKQNSNNNNNNNNINISNSNNNNNNNNNGDGNTTPKAI